MKLKTKKPRRYFHDNLQETCVTWFCYQFPWPHYLIYSIPNSAKVAGKRTTTGINLHAVRLKKQGLRKGVPDLCIPMPRGNHSGLYIEMKVGRDKLSEAQKEIMTFLAEQGYKTVIAKSFEDFKMCVTNYLTMPVKRVRFF